MTARTFDGDDLLLSETDPLGQTTTYTYADHNLTAVREPLGHTTRFLVLVHVPICGSTSISVGGYSIVSIDAASGRVRWSFGGDLSDPQLQLRQPILLVTATRGDKKLQTWELDVVTGEVVREKPPEDLNGCCMEYMSYYRCDPFFDGSDPYKLPEIAGSVRTVAIGCTTLLAQNEDEVAVLSGIDWRSARVR